MRGDISRGVAPSEPGRADRSSYSPQERVNRPQLACHVIVVLEENGQYSDSNQSRRVSADVGKPCVGCGWRDGHLLYAKGVFINRCYDELNLSLPALVRDVHQEYAKAGSEILETNTFGANRKRLAAFGFAEKVKLINHAGVRIAREAARELAFVAGAVGPLGIRLEPLGPTSFEEARAIFREQVAALIEAGVDLLVLETFRDTNEI